MATFKTDMDAFTAVFFTVLGGKFRLQETEDGYVDVIDDDGETIGDAHRIYSDGWAVHAGEFAGYVPDTQIVMVE